MSLIIPQAHSLTVCMHHSISATCSFSIEDKCLEFIFNLAEFYIHEDCLDDEIGMRIETWAP